MKNLWRVVTAIFVFCLLLGCKGSNPNGTLSFDESSILVKTGSFRELILTLSGSTGVKGLNVVITSSNPSVATVNPAACVLSSLPESPQSCEILVEGVADGTATISATAPGYTVNPVAVTVSSSAVVPGILVFDKTSESVTVNSTNHVKLSLKGSSGVSNLVVTLASSNSGTVTTTPVSCTLSSGANRSCEVTLNGISLGTAQVTASAPGYSSPSLNVNVVSTPIPGSISFSTTIVSVGVSEIKQVMLDLNDSSGVSGLVVSLSSSDTSFATVSPSSCTLSSGPTTRHCTVTITGVALGSASINAIATGYTIHPVSVTVTQSYVPTTQFGVQNNCGYTVWMQAINPPTSAEAIVEIPAGRSHDYAINGQYLNAFRVWPKTGCDSNGQKCNTGQQLAPCQNNVCQPAIDSLWEGTFNDPGNFGYTTHDTSLVTGFTLPFIAPVYKASGDEGNAACITSDASSLSLSGCPTDDDLSIAGSSGVYGADGFGPYPTYMNGDMPPTVVSLNPVNEQSTYPTTNKVEGCMAPVTVMTYTNTSTFGGLNLGANTMGYTPTFISPVILYSCGFNSAQLINDNPAPAIIEPGQEAGFNHLSSFCNQAGGPCTMGGPNGPAASQVCNAGPINETKYVKYIHANTTNIYAQTFDDRNGTSTCFSPQTKYAFILCPTH